MVRIPQFAFGEDPGSLGDVAGSRKVSKNSEKGSTLCEIHPSRVLFTTDQWPCVDGMVDRKSMLYQSVMDFVEIRRDIMALIVEDETQKVKGGMWGYRPKCVYGR